MAATSVYSSLFASASSSAPGTGRPISSPFGDDCDIVSYTYADTSLDDAGDFVGLIPVRYGKKLVALAFTCGDGDSGTGVLDMDIILRTTNSAGTNTDTILYNAGTAFATAITTVTWVLLPTLPQVPSDADNVGIIGTYVNTARNGAATPTMVLLAMWR